MSDPSGEAHHPYFDLPRPVVLGHRGAAGTVPENTLESFAAALAAGATVLESDVHVTRDGVPVLLHDPEVDRALALGDLANRDYSSALERLDRYLAARSEIALDTYGIYLYTLARNGRMAEARAFMDRAGFQSIPSAVVAPFLSWFVDRFELDEPQASLTTQAALRD